MEEMLRRFEAEQAEVGADGGDESEVGLEERLGAVDLDDPEAVWARLTTAERAAFEAASESGGLLELLRPEAPWWEAAAERSAGITEVGGVGDDGVPQPGRPIPPLAAIMGSRVPAKELMCNLVDVLYGYAFGMRRCDAEAERARAMLAASAVLGDAAVHGSVEGAVAAVVDRAAGGIAGLEVPPAAAVELLADVAALLERASFVLGALVDGVRVLEQALHDGERARPQRRATKDAARRLWFYAVWWQAGAPGAVLPADVARATVAAERVRRRAELEAVAEERRRLEQSWRGPRPPPSLIEEV